MQSFPLLLISLALYSKRGPRAAHNWHKMRQIRISADLNKVGDGHLWSCLQLYSFQSSLKRGGKKKQVLMCTIFRERYNETLMEFFLFQSKSWANLLLPSIKIGFNLFVSLFGIDWLLYVFRNSWSAITLWRLLLQRGYTITTIHHIHLDTNLRIPIISYLYYYLLFNYILFSIYCVVIYIFFTWFHPPPLLWSGLIKVICSFVLYASLWRPPPLGDLLFVFWRAVY